jgi:[protein-PII] uridylyltransferase
VPTLQQIIEADADASLPAPTERDAALDLAPYRNFLKVEKHRLRLRHRAGAGGREICRGHATIIDALLHNLWRRAKQSLSPQAQREFPPLALVALGGYGRGELNPKSDLDVMLLHYGQVVASVRPLPHLSKMIEFILMPLYDLGFKVGHSVRTIEDCVQLANRDMQTKTSLIEARLIVGDEKLFVKFQKAIVSRCVENHVDAYIRARIGDQATRRNKFGNSPTMQEPNVKNGCGGLRDFQNLCWMAFFKHRTRSLEELQEREFITAVEAKRLEAAYDFLLRVRNELHCQTERATDVLAKGLQPALAGKLGFTDRSPRRRLEAFMREYYHHSRNIYLITRTVEERLALLPKAGALPAIRNLIRRPFARPREQTVDGFLLREGQIHPGSGRVFRDQPRRLMRVFLHAQKRGMKLHPDTVQMIRHQLYLVDRKFLRDTHVRNTFLEILNQRGNVSRWLRAMHEVGLLGKYLPEFGKMTCLVQHEYYHQYTADEHTLICLEQLDQIWESKDPLHASYAEMFQTIERPFILYLALLLHDSGKALNTGNHSETGALLATKAAHRLGLDGATTHSLQILIEHHLLMAQISQRRDLEDPAVIRHFAAQIQSAENLRMLTLHTFADSQATSDQLWNGFKESLLWQLHHKTMAELTGATAFIQAEARQRELLAEEVNRLQPDNVSEEEQNVHFQALPARYYQIHPAREIVLDLTLVHRFMAHQLSADPDQPLQPVVAWHNEPDRGYTSAKVCTWDRAGLFGIMAGSFAAAGVNILSAQVFTHEDDIVLDTFYVTDARGGGTVGREDREKFESILLKALTKGSVDFRTLIARLKTARPLYQSLEGEAMPVRVNFDNQSSEERTVIEIESEDRLGLLYVISDALTELGLNIYLAKILTEKGAAIDSFYVTEPGGLKITDLHRQEAIDKKLHGALEAMETWKNTP